MFMAAITQIITKKYTSPEQWFISSFPPTPVQEAYHQVTQGCECCEWQMSKLALDFQNNFHFHLKLKLRENTSKCSYLKNRNKTKMLKLLPF